MSPGFGAVAYRGGGGGESPRAALPKGGGIFKGNGAAFPKVVARNACKIGGYRRKNENLKVNDGKVLKRVMGSSQKGGGTLTKKGDKEILASMTEKGHQKF